VGPFDADLESLYLGIFEHFGWSEMAILSSSVDT
jgi:hypothetical protein